MPPKRKASRRVTTVASTAERLPIGYESRNAKKQFYVVVPTKDGGRLTLTISSGNARTIEVKKGTKRRARGTSTAIRLDLPPGDSQGRYDVTIDEAEKLKCEFVQKGRARVSERLDAEALVPWVFFYWPYGGTWPTKAAQTMAKFGRYLGLETTRRRVGKVYSYKNAAGDWETQNHKKKGKKTFEGHCHAASNASALFETPVEKTVRNADDTADLTFSIADLKLLATEYYANYGREETIWEPAGTMRVGDDEANWFLPAYFKPEGPWTKDAFEGALTECNFKEENIESWVNYFGSEDGESFDEDFLEDALNSGFGESAAKFFKTLIAQMLYKGQPLISNMREASEEMSCSPVWNQAFYEYAATFVENESELDMHVDCELTANSDNTDPSTPPLKYRYKWRLLFKKSGDVDTAAESNRWLESRLFQNGADDVDYKVYIPTDLTILKPCATGRTVPDNPVDGGNPHINHKLLDLIQIRNRFKP